MWSGSCQTVHSPSSLWNLPGFPLDVTDWFPGFTWCLMFLFICCLTVEEVIYMKHRDLAEVDGLTVRGRWAFEERWVQRRGGNTSKLCASFSKYRWAHGNPGSSNVGVLKQVWAISPPCAACIFRLFQSHGGFLSADRSCQSEQRLPLVSGSEQVLIPPLLRWNAWEGHTAWLCILVGATLPLSSFFQVIFSCETSGSQLVTFTMSTAVSWHQGSW